MDFLLEERHEMIQELIVDLVEKQIMPAAKTIDESQEFPMEIMNSLGETGFMGISLPEAYGGQECDYLTYILSVEELAKGSGTVASIYSAHSTLCMDTILAFGTDEQKDALLPDLAAGEKIGALAIQDTKGSETLAVKEGNDWIIDGSKEYVINGLIADLYVVSAVTGSVEKNGKMKKISSYFYVEKDTPGLSVGDVQKMIGYKGNGTCKIQFNHCRIPASNLIGEEGKGYLVFNRLLTGARISVAAQALGLAEAAYDKTVRYVKERKQFGLPLAVFQNTQVQIAEMSAKIASMKLLVYQAACIVDSNKDASVEAAQAKLIASRFALEIATKAVQLHGGYGYTWEYEVERLMREAKMTAILEGTPEAQCMVIAKSALK